LEGVDGRVSVRQVEKLTGLTFFSTLPKELADELKGKVDDVEIPAVRPRGGSRDKGEKERE
jgi:hypothetical protein